MAESVSKVLQEIVRDHFDGNQRKAADALGMSGAHLSNLIAGLEGRGPGLSVLIAMSDFTNRSIDDILGRGPRRNDKWIHALESLLQMYPRVLGPQPLPTEPNYERRVKLRAEAERALTEVDVELDGTTAALQAKAREELRAISSRFDANQVIRTMRAGPDRRAALEASMAAYDAEHELAFRKHRQSLDALRDEAEGKKRTIIYNYAIADEALRSQ